MSRARGLHLLVVGLSWPPETFLQWKLEGLSARGMRVTAAAVMAEGDAGVRLRGVEVARQPHWDESRPRMLAGLLGSALRLGLRSPHSLAAAVRAARRPLRESTTSDGWGMLYRLRGYVPLARLRPDVVHFEWNSAAIQFLPLRELWGCPTAVSCHGSDVNVRPHLADVRWARWLRASFAAVTAVHVVSNAVAEEAAAVGMDPRRAWLIPPGVDPDRFRPGPAREARDGALRVVTVSDLRWLKGHTYAVRTVRRLLDMGVPAQLEIAGGDPREATGEDSDRARVEHAIDHLGLRGHVRLTGQLSSDEVCERVRGADVLLHTSLTEGLPTAVLEAMACGVPVVTSDAGGVREAVTDGVEGFVVPLRSPAEAADAVRALYEDPELRGRMGAAGRERVLSEFSLDRQLEGFVEMYESLAAGVAASRRPPNVRGGRPEPEELRLVSVAPLEWSQGLDDAMQAVALLVERGIGCHYRIVGDGPHRHALRFARRQLGIERHVEVVRGHGDWRGHLEWADVYVDASVADPPRRSLEAARALGLPVAAAGADPDALAELVLEAAPVSAAAAR